MTPPFVASLLALIYVSVFGGVGNFEHGTVTENDEVEPNWHMGMIMLQREIRQFIPILRSGGEG